MDRSKGRIAAVMLSALACSGASKADTRALSTAGKILTALGVVVGATEIYNEVSAVVRKKQGKELNWYTGKYSIYNRFLNSEKKQILTLDANQKLVIETMFKNAVNEDEEDDNILQLKKFFNGEMLVGTSKEAQEGFEIFKKFLDSQLTGVFVRGESSGGKIVVNDGKSDHVTFYLLEFGNNKFALIYKMKRVLEEK